MRVHINERAARREGLTCDEARRLIHRVMADTPSRILKEDDRSVVTRHDVDGRSWVLKRYRLPLWKRLVYGAARCTPAWREWRGAAALAALDVRVSRPIVLASAGALLLPFHSGRSLHHWMRETADRPRRLNVARSVGAQMGRIAAAGLVNRDHKPTNLIVDEPCASGHAQPIVIDPAGMRRRTPGKLLRMFAVMHRAAARAGGMSAREGLTAVRAALRADPTICPGRAAIFAREVAREVGARPLSYDPADWV